jgi:hypothetical protein
LAARGRSWLRIKRPFVTRFRVVRVDLTLSGPQRRSCAKVPQIEY